MLKVILPEIDLLFDTPQHTPYHLYDVGNHTLKAVLSSEQDRILRWTLFLHDVGKPLVRSTDKNGQDHFYGHEETGAKLARKILTRLRMDKRAEKTICLLIAHHRYDLKTDVVSVRKKAAQLGKENFAMLLKVMEADTLAHSPEAMESRLERLETIKRNFDRILHNGDPLTLDDLAVNGGDLIGLGFSGEKIGEILQTLLAHVLEVPADNQKEALLSLAEEKSR